MKKLYAVVDGIGWVYGISLISREHALESSADWTGRDTEGKVIEFDVPASATEDDFFPCGDIADINRSLGKIRSMEKIKQHINQCVVKSFERTKEIRKPSKLMNDIYEALMTQDRKTASDLEHRIYRLSDPNDHNGGFCGDYHITFSDLEFWRDWFLCSKHYDDPVNPIFDSITRGFTGAIFDKRRDQTKTRYKKLGLSPEHVKLLKNMRPKFNLWYGDGDCIYFDGKRPFGNSNIVGDIYDILEWTHEVTIFDDENEPILDEEKTMEIFEELEFAIVDVFRNI